MSQTPDPNPSPNHPVQVLSGAAKAAGFARRIYSAFLLSGGVGVAFIAQDAEEALGHGARQLIICALAALVALAQVLLEPISRMYLACTSPISRLYLACICSLPVLLSSALSLARVASSLSWGLGLGLGLGFRVGVKGWG